MRMRSMWSLTATFALSGALLLGGCSDEDGNGGTNPGGNNTDIPQSIAQEQAEASVELANSLIISVQELAANGSSGLSGLGGDFILFKGVNEPVESATYDGSQWNYSYMYSYSEGDQAYEADMTGTLQFLDVANSPQEEPGETTASMNYSVDAFFGLDFTFTDPQTNATSSSSIDVDYVASASVTGLLTDTLGVDATGTQSVSASSNSPEGNTSFTFTMGWDMDVTAPMSGGCPSGTVSIEFGQWDVLVTYTGGSTAQWVLSENGVPVSNGTEPVGCGSLAGAGL